MSVAGSASQREQKMKKVLLRRAAAALALISLGFLAGCGGGGPAGADETPTPQAFASDARIAAVGGGTAPVPTITSPPAGATFRAGDQINFSGSATDAQDGTVPSSSLTWWAELHHDTHTHPFQPETIGGSGSVTIPVRGETSHNIWYRFHLRATDRDGNAAVVTRDVVPQKARISLTTQPAGLQLTIDGTPVTASYSVIGVVGMERTIGAPTTQTAHNRRYTFSHWSDGGAQSHTISTPSADTVWTATFIDGGPAGGGDDLAVTLSAPSSATVGTPVTLNASVTGSATRVEFYDGASLIGSDTTSPYSQSWTPPSAGEHSLTARAFEADGTSVTSTPVTVQVTDGGGGGGSAPTATLTSPTNLSQGHTGTLTINASASDDTGVAAVEFQLDGMPISQDTSPPYQASVSTWLHTTGQHVLRARARDVQGNLSPWASATVTFGGNISLPAGFTMTTLAGGLQNATAFTRAADGRLFVCEQTGELRIVRNGSLLATPFHRFTVDSQGERGLLGVALHPNFASNGWVYVYYTTPSGGAHNRVSRIVANGDVSTGAETVLVNLPNLSSATVHNGGALHFGPDGKLYVAVGENADPTKSPDLTSPLGKMLRFNEDGSIPSDNPFYDSQSGIARAIWAYGLRNPFTFAFEPGSGRMFINDVGGSDWEEVNFGVAGANYGWPSSEGPDRVSGNIRGPVWAYRHPPAQPSGLGGFFTGQAIIGGVFYPASGNFPAGYRGSYYFADYVSRFVGRLDTANGNAAYVFARLSELPVGMLVGSDGALYVLARFGMVRITPP